MPSEEAAAFEVLLDFLKRTRGFDFTGYKSTSLLRRIRKRMQSLAIETVTDYIDFLEVHPEEFASLFNTILINVTSFFRDPGAWRYLAEEILPRLQAAQKDNGSIRVWCAGVSSGQEAYSTAMLLAETLGENQYHAQVKIYATDIDEDALNQARQATYSEREVADVPSALLSKYFERVGSHFVLRKELRRAVIFGRHDLLQDAPISRIDLLICRNTLMYFNAEAQTRILGHFYFALRETGFLFLGKSEMLLTHSNLFSPVDLKWRVFSKVPRAGLSEHWLPFGLTGPDESAGQGANPLRLREAAFDLGPIAQLVVDRAGNVVAINQPARLMFGLSLRDLGRPLRDLEVSYRPVDLRSLIDEATVERHPVLLKDIARNVSSTQTQYLDIHVAPLIAENGTLSGVSITFNDVTRYRRLQEDLNRSKHELETAYEELQSTNEELETTNEELQSTNEELETTNEELQSTNEELETMNEELQSTNEELQSTNDELRERTEEASEINSFLESILSSVHLAIVVLDHDLRIKVWNQRAEDLWGLRKDEVIGTHLFNLDVGLPVEQLKQPVRAVLNSDPEYLEVRLPAVNRRGRPVEIRATVAPLTGGLDRRARGVILLMDASKKAEARP